MRGLIVVLVLALLQGRTSASGAPAAPGPAPRALTIAVSGPPTAVEYLPLHLAVAAGDVRDHGLTVMLRVTPGAVQAAEALARGEADLAATTLEAILRFALRPGAPPPQLVFALTAAPPVALLGRPGASAPSLGALAGRRVGVRAPGAPELAWLGALLAGAGLRPTDVDVMSLGPRGVAGALVDGAVDAALVEEPDARRLLAAGAPLVADLRGPEAAARALGRPTVNAGLFARAVGGPADATLAALGRALLAAEARLAAAPAEALARALPSAVVGLPEAFALRVDAARALFVPGGRATPREVAATLALVAARRALGPAARGLRPEALVRVVPLTPPAPAPRP